MGDGVGEGGRDDFLGALVEHFALGPVDDEFEEGVAFLHGGFAELAFAGGGVLVEADLREEGGGLVVLVLGPALEGMVVALVAVEAGAEEEVGGVLHGQIRSAEDLEVGGGGIVLVGAGGGEDFSRELVVGGVVVDFVVDPGAEESGAFRAEELAVHLEEVGPFVGPEIDEGGGTDELVDDLVAFGAGLALIGEEGADHLWGGGEAGEVEVDTAEEFVVGGQFGGQDFHALPFCGGEGVDLVEDGGRLPGEAGAVAHDGHGGGGIGAFIAGEDGGFAAAEGGDEGELVGGGDFGVADLEEGLAGDIPGAAVGVGGDDAELLAAADVLHDGVLGGDDDGLDLLDGEVESGALGDPIADGLVVLGGDRHALSALVGDGTGGFEEHEGIVGGGEVGAAGAVVVGEGADIEDGIVAAEGEFEAVLAFLGSVAGAGAATGGGDDGGDVADPVGGGAGFEAGDGDFGGGALATEGGGEVEGAAGEGTGEAAGGNGKEGGGLGPGDLAGDVGGIAIVELGGDEELAVGVGGVEVEGGGEEGERGDGAGLGEGFGIEGGERFAVGGEVGVCLVVLRGGGCDFRGGGFDGAEGMGDGAGLGIDDADEAVLSGGGQFGAIGREAEGEDGGVEGEGVEEVGAGGEVFLDALGFVGVPLGGGFAVDLFDVVGEGGVELGLEDVDGAFAIEAGGGGDAFAVGAVVDRPDAAGHGGELADEVGVVADDAGGDAEDAVDLGHAIGTADEDLVAFGVFGERGEAAFKGAGGNGGDVVDEALLIDLGEFGGLVAAGGNEVGAIGGEEGVEDPVGVGAHEEDLLAGFGIDDAGGVVGAAEGDLRAVR